MLTAWADQEVFVVGNLIPGYGIVTKVTDSFVSYENSWSTWKKKKDSFALWKILEAIHPEIKPID